MSDSGRRDRQLAGMLHMLSGTSAVTCSIGPASTNFVHPVDLEGVSDDVAISACIEYIPELTDFSRYSIACSWLLKLVLC